MQILLIIWLIVHAILLFWLMFHALGLLLSRLRREPVIPDSKPEADFACIITAYKSMDIAVPLVESLIRQDYPDFHIYLVADQCEGDFPIEHERLTVHQPVQPLNSKVRSMRYGVEHGVREHSHALIFDPDNLAPVHFLQRLNDYIASGYPAVQGLRVAKTSTAPSPASTPQASIITIIPPATYPGGSALPPTLLARGRPSAWICSRLTSTPTRWMWINMALSQQRTKSCSTSW
ncbi:MAG: glycosyltransferase [Bacteroidia bacterium]